MPDVFIHNQTSHILNIGFWVGTPLCFVNEVKPDQKIKVHLASFAHTIEARVDNGSNRYSTGETWQKAGELGAACAAGTAAVVVGTAWLTGLFGKHTSPVASAAVGGAGLAWGAAHAGGAQYAQEAEGVVLSVPGMWIPFHEKHFAIRFLEGQSRFVLWDEDEGRSCN